MNRTNRRVRCEQTTITNRGGVWGATFIKTDSGRPDTTTQMWINWMIAVL